MPRRSRRLRAAPASALAVLTLAVAGVVHATPATAPAGPRAHTLGTDSYRSSPGSVVGGSAYDYAPSIMVDGAYKMWWCGQAPGAKVPGDDILYAESSSPNGPFHARGSSAPHQTVFDGTGTGGFDNEHTCDPSVVRANGTYYLYYGAEQHDGEPTTIGVAASPDGINWTRLNNNEPIVTPADQQQTKNTYGAGQPSVVYRNGEFYLMFLDTTGAGALANGAGQFVWRSPDPTFQSHVEVFTASGWRARSDANSRAFSVANAISADWQYSDALRAFVIAHDDKPGQTTLSFLDPDNLARHPHPDVTVPGQWTEGPGIISRPDKHSVVPPDNDCGRIPIDLIRSTTTFPPQQLAHIGLDLLTHNDCASMPRRQLAALYEGYGLQSGGLPAAVVVSGRRLQIQNASVYTDLTHNALSVPPSIYYAIPYGGSLRDHQKVLGAPGLPGAFQLDHNALWPVSDPHLVSDNHSTITMVDRKRWLSHPRGPDLNHLR
ncbi:MULTISPECIES: beta-xylosidase [unclassified Streptomyces]|uniref:beta-xylosidase n=1 Tax=unclassified Streptomyces TaxID=2593676 RepID=UPI0003A84417|nr:MULTISPECIES: beta-xylosidase [unclassified Streptomyces]MYT28291.1 beta-xylosidase [Streptomyces sp. SID8354]